MNIFKKYRAKLGLSQSKLAALLGLSDGYSIRRIESGKARASNSLCRNLLRAYVVENNEEAKMEFIKLLEKHKQDIYNLTNNN